MSGEPFNFGEIIPNRTRFEDINGQGIINAVGVIFIQRTSDNKYWNGAAFQTTRVSIPMNEVDDVNSAGVWEKDFDSIVGLAVDYYSFELVDTSPFSIGKKQIQFNSVGRYLEDLTAKIIKVLGLMRENTTVNPIYDGADNLIAATVTQYDSKANAETDDGVTGKLNKWTIASPHTGVAFDKFTLVLEP